MNNDMNSPQEARTHLFLSGAIGALTMLVFMLLLRNLNETRSLLEIVAGATLQLMPVPIFSFMLRLLQGLAKPALLASVMIGFVIAGGLFAWLDRGPLIQTRWPGKIRRVITLTISVWVPAAILALIVTAYASAVALTNKELMALGWTTFLNCLVFAVATYLSYPLVSGAWPKRDIRADEPAADASRRKLLGQAGAGAVALAGTIYLGRFVADARSGVIGGGSNRVPDSVTPNGEFYTVSKNFIDPNVSAGNWELNIRGLVQTPVTLSYEQLKELPTVEQQATLMCISNEIGGDLISNAHWTGVKLSDLLDLAGIRPQAQKLAFYGTDGYSDSFPMSKALEPTTIVAYLMNGEPLPDKHGFPARLIVPGKYGIKNGKWLRHLELVETYRGFWQQRGWTEDATIKTMSRFDVPGERTIVDLGPVELGGVAFAGDRGISDVEISIDNGQTWTGVDTVQQISPLSWVIWRSTWTPQASGAYKLRVRAIDGDGEVQTEVGADPIPDGASGHHRLDIGVT